MKHLLCFIFSFLAIFAFLLGSILFTADNRAFYPEQYEQNNTAQQTGMSVEDLTAASDALLDYMFDRRDDISIVLPVNGVEREIFDERETQHMVDVKELFLLAINIFYICAAAAVLGMAFMLIRYKKTGLFILAKMYNIAAVVFVVVTALLGAFIAFNFNMFWTIFHQLIFTNDLWLLDPNVSIMINMFPSNFFFAMVTNILIAFVATMVVAFLSLNIPKIFIRKGANRA